MKTTLPLQAIYFDMKFVRILYMLALMEKRSCLMSRQKGIKGFYRCLHSKRKAEENVALLGHAKD